MSTMIQVTEPTMVLNEEVCKSNIARMAAKAKAANVVFRPHFKTHQSREIGEWFRASGVDKITVSSLNMAMKFAEWGWNDITVAFPVNCLEHEKINALAAKIRLNLLLVHSEGARQLSECLKYPVGVYLGVDTGYHRDGVDAGNYEKIERIMNIVAPDVNIKFEGFLTHAGHTYNARSKEEILQIHKDNLRMLKNIKERYIDRYPQLKISLGDTPSCSLADRFGVADENVDVLAAEHKHMAVVAVSAGEGLNEIFSSLGVDYVITGGQTMNPSTEDFMKAIEKVNADQVILLPNNKNIIMAADQAAKMSQNVQVQVVASRTIPQGIAALMAYDSEGELDDNAEAMTESMQQIHSAEVTYAVRDTSIDEFTIKEGQLLGIVEGKIKAVGDDMQQLINDILEVIGMDDAELVTLYYGADVEAEAADALLEHLQEAYPDAEFELYYGAQAVYSYLISVE